MDVSWKAGAGYKRNWMAIGIGEAGSRALSDFLTFSNYAEGNIGVAYFMDTRRDNLSDTKHKFLKIAKEKGRIMFKEDRERIAEQSLKKQSEEKKREDQKKTGKTQSELELSTETIVKFINYGEGGTGRSWLISEFLMKKRFLMDREGYRNYRYLDNLTPDCRELANDVITTDIIMIFHSLGGGTGGGGAPVLCRWIRDLSRKREERTRVVSICFLHFLGGFRLMANSVRNLNEVSREADFVILFSNEVLKEKLGLSYEPEGVEMLHDLNREITRTLDVLLSSTSHKTEVTGTIDPKDISSYLTMSIGGKLNLNILAPFVSRHSKSFEGELISLQDSLHNPLVPVREGEILQLLPIFLSSREEIAKEGYLESKRNELIEQVKKVQKTIKTPNVEQFFGVFDGNIKNKGRFVDTLVLALANVDLTEYLSTLELPIVRNQWQSWKRDAAEEFGVDRKISNNWFDDLKKQIVSWNADYQEELQMLIRNSLRG